MTLPSEHERDLWGRRFDPAKFRPEKDILGRWKNLRGGRKKKNRMETPQTTPAADAGNDAAGSGTAETLREAADRHAAAPAPEAVPSFADVEKALKTAPVDPAAVPPGVDPEEFQEELAAVAENPTAETAIGIIQTGLMLIGGEEGILSSVEKTLIRRPLVRVLAKYNVGKDVLPCEVDLALAVLGLVAARLQKPKTAATWEKVKAWAVGRIFARKGAQTAAALRREVGGSVGAS